MECYFVQLSSTISYLNKYQTDCGLTRNENDMCAFNKMLNSKQITVQLYVDDLEVSHKEQSVLDNCLDKLNSEFCKEDELGKQLSRYDPRLCRGGEGHQKEPYIGEVIPWSIFNLLLPP